METSVVSCELCRKSLFYDVKQSVVVPVECINNASSKCTGLLWEFTIAYSVSGFFLFFVVVFVFLYEDFSISKVTMPFLERVYERVRNGFFHGPIWKAVSVSVLFIWYNECKAGKESIFPKWGVTSSIRF